MVVSLQVMETIMPHNYCLILKISLEKIVSVVSPLIGTEWRNMPLSANSMSLVVYIVDEDHCLRK